MNYFLTVWIWLFAIAATVFVGAWVTARLLAHIDKADTAKRSADDGVSPASGTQPRGSKGEGTPLPEGAPSRDGVDSPRVRAVLRGGMWIGVLERIAVTACILVGFTAGIAVVVAVKGLGRFPQLRDDPAASERFVIGSLASLLWAAVVGFAAAGLLRLVWG